MKKIKVLFVCLGNICRSPLAEGIFKHKIKQKNWSVHVEADSCGTGNYHIGDLPDPRTIANATKNGIVIEHCGRQLSKKDIEDFDYILAMDQSNYRNILLLLDDEGHSHKIRLMREFDPVGKGEVPDPYFGGEQGFQMVFDILNRTMDEFIKYLEQQYFHKLK